MSSEARRRAVREARAAAAAVGESTSPAPPLTEPPAAVAVEGAPLLLSPAPAEAGDGVEVEDENGLNAGRKGSAKACAGLIGHSRRHNGAGGNADEKVAHVDDKDEGVVVDDDGFFAVAAAVAAEASWGWRWAAPSSSLSTPSASSSSA